MEKITLKLRLCRETENALCVWDQETKTYRGRNEIWLPKTQIAKKDLVENNDKEQVMAARALKTAMISAFLAQNGVDYLRVHDVALNKEYIEKNIAEITAF